jgi:hypothetical protein
MAGIRHRKVLHHLENNWCDVDPCFGTSSNPLGLTIYLNSYLVLSRYKSSILLLGTKFFGNYK